MKMITLQSVYNSFFYNLILLKLRFVKNKRKIRVGFWVTEPNKWTCQKLFEKFKNDEHFEPFIFLSYFKKEQENVSAKDFYNKAEELFKTYNDKIYRTFDPDNFSFESLDKYKPDIIFYQQPWQIPEPQIVKKNHKKSLLCYVPYCFYSLNSYVNYLPKFHGMMWKYFVESDFHKKEYQKKYGAINCVVTGSVKIPDYNNIKTVKKQNNKKSIIYAPHHSFNDGVHEVATFDKNGQFILELAKNNSDIEWIFRPHPVFKERIIKNKIMTKGEIENYYNEWSKIGRVSTESDYYEMLASSDCLITDCISFLTEYAPTLKPVLHLRKDEQKEEFNNFVKNIDKSYYQIYTNEELSIIFNEVISKEQDEKKELREKNQEYFVTDDYVVKQIFDYIKKALWIK